MELKEMIVALSGLMSVSGYTRKSGDKLKALLDGIFDENYTDAVGNHVFVRRCGKENAPRILIDTHFDEVGMMVTDVREGGFVTVVNVGGLDMRILQAAEVVIYGEDEFGCEKEIYGVVTSTPPHLTRPGEAKKLKEIGELFIDTGYDKVELEKYVHIGTPVGYRPIYRTLLNDRIFGKGFDCKSCGACAAVAVAETPREHLAGDVYLVFANFEETSACGGIDAAAYAIDPDYALVADVTHAVMPGDPLKEPKLGGGVSFTLAPITNRPLTKKLMSLAENANVKVQKEVASRSTGTDTVSLNLIRAGVPTVDIGLPLRNMHTYNEILSLADAEAMTECIRLFITSDEIAGVFKK